MRLERLCRHMLYEEFRIIFLLRKQREKAKISQLLSFSDLHRHGDRTPIGLYAKNVDRSFWYDSIGELTISGKLRMFNLGKYLRTRHANFLTGNPREVKIRSSMVPR
ncbi:lysosomal acid phosphatase-like protein 3, partial [Dinothrombium tinctorium]